ncbi:multidrug DMT transporter [Deinococcus murrayi]|uniref:multidrug DMT transporter n=1 Tax=Deinococcus murrayi TaxID=68910 RepID=UPI0004810337|nr:multidrug DMT transporter [Deinococcus murrayi]
MDTLLKKAGAMLAHLDLFTHMLHLRGLLQLAAHMEERGDRVTLVSPQAITLVGTDMTTDERVTTGKGATVEAANAYRVLRTLKGHDAPEYAVTREELGALNARAVAELEASDAMRAFGETLARIGVAATPAPSEAATERPGRGRRGAEAEPPTDQPAA